MNGERAMVLGAVLGLLDTLVIAAGIAAWKHGAYPSVFPAVVALGMMPALVIGIGVGCLGGFARSRPWFYLVLVPMIGGSLYLEQRTRAGRQEVDAGPHTIPRSEAGARGVVIGSCNAIFIAVALGLQEGRDVAVIVLLLGIVPALVVGYLLGILAGALQARPVLVRCAVLVLAPGGTMLLLASGLGVTTMFAPAVLPTAVCGLVLERTTRNVADLPAARARHIASG